MTDRPTKVMKIRHEKRDYGEVSLEYHKNGFIRLSERIKKFNSIYERIGKIIDDPMKGLEGKKGTYVCFENVNGKYRVPEETIELSIDKKRARNILDKAIQEDFKGVEPRKRNKQREDLAERTWDWINSVD